MSHPTFRCFRRQLVDGKLELAILHDGNAYTFATPGTLDQLGTSPPAAWDSKLSHTVAGQPSDIIPKESVDPAELFRECLAAVGGIFREDQEFEKNVVTIFILSTYLDRMFEQTPVLWLQSNNQYSRYLAAEHIRQLAYNGCYIFREHSLLDITRLIADLTPTLILRMPEAGKRDLDDRLLRLPNIRGNIHYVTQSDVRELFCPRVVVSLDFPDHPMGMNAITIQQKAELSDLPVCNYPSLRAHLLKLALLTFPVLKKTIEMRSKVLSTFNHAFALFTVAESLAEIGALPIEAREQVARTLTDLLSRARRDQSISKVQQLLMAVDTHINSNPSLDGFYPVEQLAEEARLYDGLEDIKANVLTRILNRFNLVMIEPVRRWNTISIYSNGSPVPVKRQRTYVRIDKDRLNEIIHLRLEGGI